MADSADSQKSMSTLLEELRDLVVAYAKQETVVPLRNLGRYIAFGIGGAAAIGLGASIVLLGALRLLQNETGDAFTGNWSWVPYLTVLAASGVVIALALTARARSAKGVRH